MLRRRKSNPCVPDGNCVGAWADATLRRRFIRCPWAEAGCHGVRMCFATEFRQLCRVVWDLLLEARLQNWVGPQRCRLQSRPGLML